MDASFDDLYPTSPVLYDLFPMPVDTSEKDFESTIVSTLASEPKQQSGEPNLSYDAGRFEPGGYWKRKASDYNAERCLIPEDLVDFLLATQSKEWRRQKDQFGGETKGKIVQKVSREIDRRGTLNVLRRGVKLYGCRFDLVYFRPSTSRNPELQKYRANIFAVVRQLPYSPETKHTFELGLFLNGLPIFTAELKNPLKGQTYRDAIHQYRSRRDPREPFFQFGRCAHFDVGSEGVHMTTHLEGKTPPSFQPQRGRRQPAEWPRQPDELPLGAGVGARQRSEPNSTLRREAREVRGQRADRG